MQRRERFGLPPSKEEQAKLDSEKQAAAEKDASEKKKVPAKAEPPLLPTPVHNMSQLQNSA